MSDESDESGADGGFDVAEQLRLEKLEEHRLRASANAGQVPTYTDADGTVFEWDAEKGAYFPKVDDYFMAQYQMNYGVAYDYDKLPAPTAKKQEAVAQSADDKQPIDDKSKRKRKKDKDLASTSAQSTSNTWFEVSEDKTTSVYVSNLPLDFTEEEFMELMLKCGLIFNDPFSKKPKIKLYRNEDGSLKGDGRCCYIKVESVALALQILDGWPLRDNKTMHVERAKFEIKGGEFNPTKRGRKLTNKEKRAIRERQEKLFDWRPEKLEVQRGRNERIVIIKHMFTPEELDADPDLYNDLNDDVKEEGAKAGTIKKVVICDRNPEGVVMAYFKTPEEADKCIAAMNGRWYSGKQLEASTWDGKTKYHIEETEEERTKRLEKWYNFLEQSNQNSETVGGEPGASSNNAETASTETANSAETTHEEPMPNSAESLEQNNNGNGSQHSTRPQRVFRNAAGDLSDNSDDDAAFDSTDDEEDNE